MQPTGMAFTSISPILFSTLLILYFPLNLKGYISQTMKLGALGIPSYRSFSVEELEAATNNFEPSRFMGEGSHGQVCHYRYFNSSMFTLEVLQIVACQYALWLFLLGNSFCALFMCFMRQLKCKFLLEKFMLLFHLSNVFDESLSWFYKPEIVLKLCFLIKSCCIMCKIHLSGLAVFFKII